MKLRIFILLCIIFIITLFISYTGFHKLSFLSFDKIKDKRTKNDYLIDELYINNLRIPYDSENNTYYYYVPYENNKKSICMNFNINGFKYKINGDFLNFINVEFNKEYNFIIYSKKNYYESKIVFTNLPTVQINVSEAINENDANGSMYLISDNEINGFFESNIKIHIRGGASKTLLKKAYKIELYNKKYTKTVDRSLLNMYSGNDYILDALYTDNSKIRNILSSTLWNDITDSDKTLEGEFVEVFINDNYNGLYVLKESVNAKNLNLNKNKSYPIIIKGVIWNKFNNLVDLNYINNSRFSNFEIKYPKDKLLYAESWSKILNIISMFYNNPKKSSFDTINSTFNLEDYIDMKIFNAFIDNVDNGMIKNLYLYLPSADAKVVNIIPWDMELTF